MQEWAYVTWADRQLLLASQQYLADREGAKKNLNEVAAGAIGLLLFMYLFNQVTLFAAALAAGGVLVSDRAAPAFWVLADAEGNEVCVCTWQGRD